MIKLSGIGKSSRQKLALVLSKHPGVLTSRQVANVSHISLENASKLLSRWSKNGWVYRIKKGAYVSVPIDSINAEMVTEDPLLIADKLYSPGYVGGFSAIKYWDLSEQIFESVTYFSCKQFRNQHPVCGGLYFQLKTIADYKLFGTKNIWFGSYKVKVSDPTKTIIDFLDDPKLAGGISVISDFFSEYLESEYYNFDLLIDYANKMRNKTIFKRLGFLLETKFDTSDKNLAIIKSQISTGLSKFDPTVNNDRVVKKWGLKISSSWKKMYDRKK
jgi:predicted transcriptional regulator of viral defense system